MVPASVAVPSMLRAHPASLKFAISMYYLAAAVCVLGTLWGGEGPAVYGGRRHSSFAAIVPSLTRHLARLHDLVVGYVYFAVFAPLSAIRVVDVVQTWLLFHNALSEGVVVDDILKQAASPRTCRRRTARARDRPAPTPGRAPAAAFGALLEGRDGRPLPGRVSPPPPRSDSDSAVDGGRRSSAPASLSPPADAAAFSFSSPRRCRRTMSDLAPASGGLALCVSSRPSPLPTWAAIAAARRFRIRSKVLVAIADWRGRASYFRPFLRFSNDHMDGGASLLLLWAERLGLRPAPRSSPPRHRPPSSAPRCAGDCSARCHRHHVLIRRAGSRAGPWPSPPPGPPLGYHTLWCSEATCLQRKPT